MCADNNNNNNNLAERFNELVERYVVVKGQESLLIGELAEYGENSIWPLGWKKRKEKRRKVRASEEEGEPSESDLEYRRLESSAVRLCNELSAIRLEMAKVVLEPFLNERNHRFDSTGSVAFHPVFNAQAGEVIHGALTRDVFLYYQRNAVGDISGDRILVNPSLVADSLLNDVEGRECLRWFSGEDTGGGLAEPLEEHVKALNFVDYDETEAEPFTWLGSRVLLKQKDLYERMSRHREGHGQQQLNIAERDENDQILQGTIPEDRIPGNDIDAATELGSFGELVGDAKAVFLRHSLDYARLDGLCKDAEVQQKLIVDFFKEVMRKKSSIQDVASSLESEKTQKKKSGKALSKNIASWRTFYTFDLISVLNVGSDIRPGEAAANPVEAARDDTSGLKDFYYLEESKHKYRLMCVLLGSFPAKQVGMMGRFTKTYAAAKLVDFRAVVDWNLVGNLLKKLSLTSSLKKEEIDAKHYQFDSERMRFDEFFAAGVGRDPDEGLPYTITAVTEGMLSEVPNIRDKLNTYMKKRRALFKKLGYKPIVNTHCKEGFVADI